MYANAQNTFEDYSSRWSFENNAIDEKNLNNGSIGGNAAFSIDHKEGDKSLYLDGGTGYFSVPNSATFNNLEKFTISFWFKIETMPTGLPAFITGEDNNYRVVLHPEKVISFVVRSDNGWYGEGSYIISNTQFEIDKWYNVVAVYDGIDAKKSYLYVNGIQDTINPQTISGMTNDWNWLWFACGQGDDTYTSFFNGYFDDVRFYNIALSAGEVSKLYDFYPGTLAVSAIDKKDDSITLFPNPTNDILFIQNLSQRTWVDIVSSNGQLLYHDFFDAGKESIDMNKFKEGIYFLSIYNEEQNVVKKIVVSK